jgi:hypothetical protein
MGNGPSDDPRINTGTVSGSTVVGVTDFLSTDKHKERIVGRYLDGNTHVSKSANINLSDVTRIVDTDGVVNPDNGAMIAMESLKDPLESIQASYPNFRRANGIPYRGCATVIDLGDEDDLRVISTDDDWVTFTDQTANIKAQFPGTIIQDVKSSLDIVRVLLSNTAKTEVYVAVSTDNCATFNIEVTRTDFGGYGKALYTWGSGYSGIIYLPHYRTIEASSETRIYVHWYYNFTSFNNTENFRFDTYSSGSSVYNINQIQIIDAEAGGYNSYLYASTGYNALTLYLATYDGATGALQYMYNYTIQHHSNGVYSNSKKSLNFNSADNPYNYFLSGMNYCYRGWGSYVSVLNDSALTPGHVLWTAVRGYSSSTYNRSTTSGAGYSILGAAFHNNYPYYSTNIFYDRSSNTTYYHRYNSKPYILSVFSDAWSTSYGDSTTNKVLACPGQLNDVYATSMILMNSSNQVVSTTTTLAHRFVIFSINIIP